MAQRKITISPEVLLEMLIEGARPYKMVKGLPRDAKLVDCSVMEPLGSPFYLVFDVVSDSWPLSPDDSIPDHELELQVEVQEK